MYVEWTRTHAHFLQMGGFRLRCSREEKDLYSDILQFHSSLPDGTWEGVLTYRAFTHFLGTGRLACPRVSLSEAEIMDTSKSKGDRDGLSKTVAVLQLLWFVLQVVVRAGIGLDVTTVELTTGALVAAAVAMYWCWWSKPLNVQCAVVLYLSNQADEVETEDGDTSVPSESSCHIELPDSEDGLSVNQILAPQSDGETGATRPTLPMSEIDKERLESQECKDDLEGKRAQGHHRSLVRSVAQLASKGRATLSRMSILIHKAQYIFKWLPRSLVWLRSHLSPLAVCIAGYIVVWPVEAITGPGSVEHNRYASGARATSSSMLDAAHSSVLTAFFVSDPTANPIDNPGTGAGGGGGGGGGQSVIAGVRAWLRVRCDPLCGVGVPVPLLC